MRFAFALRINSGKIILIEQCRTACGLSGIAFSRGGVVEESGICSAGFLRKHPRCGERASPLRLLTAFASTSPFGRAAERSEAERASPLTEWSRPFAGNTPLGKTGHVALKPETFPLCQGLPPLGELAPQVTERASPLAERARSVKCASNVSGHDPTGESSVWSGPQAATNAN